MTCSALFSLAVATSILLFYSDQLSSQDSLTRQVATKDISWLFLFSAISPIGIPKSDITGFERM